MSILEARLDGKTTYSVLGEELRGKEVVCKHCPAKMHVHKYPTKEGYYFALNPGETHTGVCKYYEGDKNAPVFTGKYSPEQFIDGLAPSRKSSGSNVTSDREVAENGDLTDKPTENGPKNSKALKHIIKAGMYDEFPFDKTYLDSRYRFIDLVIFDKWARHVWTDKQLVDIGARVIDTRWWGSLNLSDAAYKRLIDHMKTKREIWFTTFWRQDGEYVLVRFCLDCNSCFGEIKNKLFASGIHKNGTYNDFAPKTGDKVDVLIGTHWARMTKDQCKDKCPLNTKCTGCLGAYWGKCDGPKRVELFPTDKLTKNKER